MTDTTLNPHLSSPGSMLRHWATHRPDEPMLTFGNRTLTWSEGYARARCLSGALQAQGIQRGDRVAFLDRSSIEFFELFFACSLLGAVSVALNWRLAPAEIGAIVEDAGAKILLFGIEYQDTVTELLPMVTCVESAVPLDSLDAWIAERVDGVPADPGFEPDTDDVVTQLYTSGTTGLPKGVMITGGNLKTILHGAAELFRIDSDTVSMAAMPLFHIGGVGWALSGMTGGGHTVILRDVDPTEILRLIETHGVTETFVVPAVLMFLLASPALTDADVSSLRTVFYGASPISEDVLVRSMEALDCDFAQVYGLTETTGAITSLMPEDHDPTGPKANLLRSAGRPYPHVELRIIDSATGEDLPVGAVGEVLCRSTQTMLGYWNKPAETAAAIDSEGWFKTGDAGWLSEDGYLFLHDRIKDMIVSGGENVYPAEVENALLSHAAVADAAVIGVPHERWGETVKAIVVRSDGVDGSDEEVADAIIADVRNRLAHYKCPTSVDFVESLPRNPSGKILKRELRAPFWEGRERNIG